MSGPIALGQRRLAIIDLSSSSNQPMVDAELGLVVVFNGTIYNYVELRKYLLDKGYHFFSRGDTEVILKLYHHYGITCVEKLHGVFSFAIWDMRNEDEGQRLFLARDRLGIKPLYWTSHANYIRFASTTQALLAAGGVDDAIDPVSLHHLFTLHAVVPAPRTILAGVKKLPPAHTITIGNGGKSTERRYWSLNAQRPSLPCAESEWAHSVQSALQTAIKRRLIVADVPVGILLSGGLDSSLLVSMVAAMGHESIHTFSIGFEDVPEERGNEFEYSDLVAEHFHTNHHRIVISNAHVLERLPEAIASMGEPMFAQDAVAFYLLAEQVAQEVKVVQSGQGADEVFGGYFWYPRMQQAKGTWLERFRNHYFDRDHAEYLAMVNPFFHGDDYTATLIDKRLQEPGADSFIDQVLRLDVTTLIVDDPVKRVDNMTMAWGVEARVPFLDQHVVELAASLPPELKLNQNGKYILKKLSRNHLPDIIIDRPKGYFPLPALKFVRGAFLDFMHEILTSQTCRQRGIYQQDYLEKLLKSPEQYLTRIQGNKLWHLAALELWLQVNMR